MLHLYHLLFLLNILLFVKTDVFVEGNISLCLVDDYIEFSIKHRHYFIVTPKLSKGLKKKLRLSTAKRLNIPTNYG